MPKFCERCGELILPDEEWEPRDVITPTGPGGGTFYLHKVLCRRVEAAQPLRYPRGRG